MDREWVGMGRSIIIWGNKKRISYDWTKYWNLKWDWISEIWEEFKEREVGMDWVILRIMDVFGELKRRWWGSKEDGRCILCEV